MNKVPKIASWIHLILWIALLLISVVVRVTFNAPESEPLDYELSKGVYNAFIIVSLAGILTSTLSFLTVKHMKNPLRKEKKGFDILLRSFVVAACVMFYVSCVLIFVINEDAVIIAPILWMICVVFCSAMLIVSKTKKVGQEKNR